MNEINYKLIGNIRKDYEHKERIASMVGLIVDPQLVLKTYYMIESGKVDEDIESFENVKKFLTNEVRKEKISPLTGLGFVILSKDMLNVARWDTEYPIVLKNKLYGYNYEKEGDLIKTAEPLDVNEYGSFCIWELGIVNHERNAWRKYLISEKMENDKKRYLENFIAGGL